MDLPTAATTFYVKENFEDPIFKKMLDYSSNSKLFGQNIRLREENLSLDDLLAKKDIEIKKEDVGKISIVAPSSGSKLVLGMLYGSAFSSDKTYLSIQDNSGQELLRLWIRNWFLVQVIGNLAKEFCPEKFSQEFSK
jgi:hypothetical protein